MSTICKERSCSSDLTQLWATLLRHQVSLSLPLEIPFFFNCAAWCQADSVMDLGTGSGEHLFSLNRYFPTKNYTGVDTSAELIGLANERLSGEQKTMSPNIYFTVGDAYTLATAQPFDVVLARLLVQHLKDLDRFLDSTSKLLAPGGALIIIESNDSVRRFIPELPLLRNLFQELRIVQKRIDGERDAGAILKQKASSFGFQLDQDQQIIIPSSLASNKKLFQESYRSVFDIMRHHYGIDLNQKALEAELDDWYHDDASYAQIGVNLTCYLKKQPKISP